MRNLDSRFLLSFIQVVQVPHPHGKQKMMYMQFGSDGFAPTINTCTGLKREESQLYPGLHQESVASRVREGILDSP